MLRNKKRQSIKRTEKKNKSTFAHSNNKSKQSSKSSKSIHKSKRSKCWMAQQRLNSKFFNFGKLDKEIMKLAHDYNTYYNSDSKKAPSKYIFTALRKYYVPYVIKFGSWTNYKLLFKGTNKQVAKKLWFHIGLRVSVFYYLQLMNSKKFNPNKNKSNGAQTNVRPPLIAMIMHDKDKSKNPKRIYVSPHIHLAIYFRDKRVNVNKLAKWIGIQPQNIQTKTVSNSNRKYEWPNMQSYLIHAKDPDKHSYPIDDVLANYDYKGYASKHVKDWKTFGKANKLSNEKDKVYNEYLCIKDDVQLGKISMFDILTNLDYYYPWSWFAVKSPDKPKFYARRVEALRTLAEKQGKYFMPVIYVTGDSGSGKTYFVEKVIRKLCKDWKMNLLTDVFEPSSGKNQMDEYLGQPIAFFDEMRSTYFDAQKLLDVLGQDPKLIGARYHNVRFVPRVLFITSIQSSDEFFGHVKKQAQSEQLGQFYRRLAFVVKIYHNHKVGLFVPAHIMGKEFHLHRNEIYGLPIDRPTKYYLYPRPKHVEQPVPHLNSGLQWISADKDFPTSQKKAINNVVNIIEKCNDYKGHSKFIHDMLHGAWPKDVDYKDYVKENSIELHTDKIIQKLKNEENPTSSSDDDSYSSSSNYSSSSQFSSKSNKASSSSSDDATDDSIPF